MDMFELELSGLNYSYSFIDTFKLKYNDKDFYFTLFSLPPPSSPILGLVVKFSIHQKSLPLFVESRPGMM